MRKDRRAITGLTLLILLLAPAQAAALPVSFSNPVHVVVGNQPRGIATGDFNADGDPDLAVANELDGDVRVLLGTAGGEFTPVAPDRPVGGLPHAIVTGNFNAGSGPLDLAVANLDDDTVSVLAGTGTGTFGAAADFPVGDEPRGLAMGLFDNGLDLDLAVANQGSDDVSVLVGGAGTSFTPAADVNAGEEPLGVASADFNADGDPDLAVANRITDNVSILLGGTGATFSGPTQLAAGDAPRAVAASDFNGDGDPDLAVPNQLSRDVSIYLGLPGAGFTPAASVPADGAPVAIASVDLTRDGDPDLALGNADDSMSVVVGGAGGSFSGPARFAVGNAAFSVAAADFDGDGEQDVVTGNLNSDDVTVLLNRTAPDTALTSGPEGLTNDATPTFGFSADEPGASFECRVDAAAFAACSSPLTTAALPDGAHTFQVKATDPAGNADASPATRAITIDATAPETTVDSGPAGLTRDSTPTFGFSANEGGATFACRVDGAAFAACSAPLTTAALPDGAHTFEVRATDAAGNADGTPAARSITVDATAPQTRIAAGPRGGTTDLSPTFRFTSSDAGSTFECRVDARAFAACSSPFTSRRLKRGRHRFEVRATDAAGNRDSTPARRSFTALLRIDSPVTHSWRFGRGFAIAESILVKRVPKGARVQARCAGGGCPFKRKRVKPDRRRRANVAPLLRRRSLRTGTVVEVRVTARFSVGKVVRLRVLDNRVPRQTTLCLRPGAKRPRPCGR